MPNCQSACALLWRIWVMWFHGPITAWEQRGTPSTTGTSAMTQALRNASYPPNKWPGTRSFGSAEPCFTPIVINGARAPAVVFGNTRDPFENDARGFHFPSLSRALVHYLIYTFKN